MKKFWIDWVAISFAVVGIILMSLIYAPVEQFLNYNSVGEDVQAVLNVTCKPVIIATFFLMPDNKYMMLVGSIVLQGLVYFLIGKAVSVCVRIILRKKEASLGGPGS